MDQFSHDLTVALEETSLLDRARVCRWGQQRRRTRSTGNLPCAPQPTEDSSSPTDIVVSACVHHSSNNVDGLDTQNLNLPSDSDEKDGNDIPRLLCKPIAPTMRLLGTLESDSLNETFSPARFFKPSARRKRKLKRISMDYELCGSGKAQLPVPPTTPAFGTGLSCTASSTGSMRKRVLKPDPNSRSQLFFCGKRKRSNRDRYHDNDHSTSMPRHNNHMEEYRMRPRSFSSTSKPHSDRLLPLNKGLLSKIERISQLQRLDTNAQDISSAEQIKDIKTDIFIEADDTNSGIAAKCPITSATTTDLTALEIEEMRDLETAIPSLSNLNTTAADTTQQDEQFRVHRKKRNSGHRRRRLLQFVSDQHSMDCEELNEFSSSSSISSSDSENHHAVNDTDREGDDELTDWPGNENVCGELKYDIKRKLTKRNTLPQIKSDPESAGSLLMAEDDTVMSNNTTVGDASTPLNWSTDNRDASTELPYQSSEPINIANKFGFASLCRGNAAGSAEEDDTSIPLKQIESEMSGETSNPFLSSPPSQLSEVRELRAGCRRVKSERPGFSIKTSVNERLARFLQDPRQLQIRLPDLEIYEHESLINLATLYSLKLSLDNGCAVLNKTSNTTQTVDIDSQSLQGRLALSDFKRRCYESKDAEMLHK